MPRRPSFARATALVLAAAFTAPAAFAADRDHPHLVRVSPAPGITVQRLVDEGFDVSSAGSRGVLLLTSDDDEVALARLGATFTIVDPAPGTTLAARSRAELAAAPRPAGRRVRLAPGPDGAERTAVLPPFGSGSMGGFWTLAEVKLKLDDLVASDTHDVVADRLDTLGTTWAGRPVWGLEIGKRWTSPDPDPRPVVYYHALIHAREPEAMQALFYFVDDLLGKYGSDPEATHLLDQRRIYLCPVVNPDGYFRNESTYVASGHTAFGMWRKNLRDNDANGLINGQDGVDLNRNFGYQWGLNSGSSGTFSSDTYRGPVAFSEPETRAQRDRVVALKPVTGVAYHTSSNLYLNPWGYTPAPTADSLWFFQCDDEFARSNGYQTGQSPRVLYTVSGEFNDWTYGETGLKPRAYTWTPEIGNDNDGFWPPPSRIVPLAAENLHMAYTVAAIAGPHVRAAGTTLLAGPLNAGYFASLAVDALNLGLQGATGVTGMLASLSDGASVPGPTAAYGSIAARSAMPAPTGEWFTIAADDTVTPGRVLRFQLTFTSTDGALYSRDTVDVVCGTPTVRAQDDGGSGLGQWSTSGWGTEAATAFMPSTHFSDSPGVFYPANMNRFFTLAAPLDLSQGVHAYVFHRTVWDYEKTYDGARFEASLDGVNWTPVPATETTPGAGVADATLEAGVPSVTGNRHLPRLERVDLSAFAGPGATAVRFRVRATSDIGLQFDGMALDDIAFALYDPAAQPVPTATGDSAIPSQLVLAAPVPNPAHGRVAFAFALPHTGSARLEVFDLAGRRVRVLATGPRLAGRYVQGWDLADDTGRPAPAGVYLARLTTEAGARVRRLAVLR
jgi:hypothetical protein